MSDSPAVVKLARDLSEAVRLKGCPHCKQPFNLLNQLLLSVKEKYGHFLLLDQVQRYELIEKIKNLDPSEIEIRCEACILVGMGPTRPGISMDYGHGVVDRCRDVRYNGSQMMSGDGREEH